MMLARTTVIVGVQSCTIFLQQLLLPLEPSVYPHIIHALSKVVLPPYQPIS